MGNTEKPSKIAVINNNVMGKIIKFALDDCEVVELPPENFNEFYNLIRREGRKKYQSVEKEKFKK